MKRLIRITIVILLLVLLGLWSPWANWNINLSGLFGVEVPVSISGLQVYSLVGEIEVYVDSQKVGTVNVEKSPLIVDKINPGERLIKISRVSNVSNAYWSYSGIINFEENKDVVIAYGLGPEKEFSEGHIIYSTEKVTETQNNLLITTNIEDTTILIDGNKIDVSEFVAKTNIDLNKQHEVAISKSGYETISFKLLPENEEDRSKLSNSVINVDAFLMVQPLKVE